MAGVLAYAFLARPEGGGDFFFVWKSVRTLLAGHNPYHIAPLGPENPAGDPLQYPLPALLIVAPFAWLPLPLAGALFLGTSSALLAFGVLLEGYSRLPIFMGAPFLMAVSLGQWSPLITAAALQANLGFAFAAKPNLGVPAWLYRPNRRAIVSALLIVLISFVVLPSWPIDWYHNVSTRPEKFFPLRTVAGPVLLLAAIRWRRPESRLFLAMVCVPQALFFYDQLILGLIPRTFRQSLIFALASFALLLTWFYRLGPGDYYVQKAIPYATALYFVALAILLLPDQRPARREAFNSAVSESSPDSDARATPA